MTKRHRPMPAPHEGKSIAGPITEQEKRRRMRAIHGADAINALRARPYRIMPNNCPLAGRTAKSRTKKW